MLPISLFLHTLRCDYCLPVGVVGSAVTGRSSSLQNLACAIQEQPQGRAIMIAKSILALFLLACAVPGSLANRFQAKKHHALNYFYWEHPGGELMVIGKWENGNTKWLETDGGLSEFLFEETARSEAEVTLFDPSRKLFVRLLHGNSWLKWDGQERSHELFKGDFVPRPFTWTSENGQIFVLAGRTVNEPGHEEKVYYSINKNSYNGETKSSYTVDWAHSNAKVLVLVPEHGDGDKCALYEDGKLTSGQNTADLSSWTVLTTEGKWSSPERSYMPAILYPPYDVYKFGSTPDAKDSKRGNSKIAILTLNTPNIYEYSDLAEINQKEYAKRHGYDFYVYRDSTLGWEMEKGSWDSIVTWNKVNAIPRHLQDHEWMMWIDSDAVFTNMNITLESIIEKASDKEFLIADDPAGWMLNTGVMFFRNTEWTRNMIQKWWTMPKHQHNMGAEQKQLIKLLDHHDKERKMWHLFPECEFNCLPKNRFEGVFVVHYMGHWPDEKIAALTKENVKLGLMPDPSTAEHSADKEEL
eukprot:CFRG7190T1